MTDFFDKNVFGFWVFLQPIVTLFVTEQGEK